MNHSISNKDMFFHTQHNQLRSTHQLNSQKAQASIKKIYSSYCEADTSKRQTKLLWKLIKLCYNNINGQRTLMKMLNLPQTAGPISLNPLPSNLLEHNQEVGEGGEQKTTQLEFLFDFLKNIEENYFCWIIYYSEDLKILNLKLLRQDQLQQYEDLFNPNLNLIGIFTTKEKTPIKRPVNRQQLQNEFNEEGTLYKKHAKSTPNNSTGSSWKNPTMEVTQSIASTSQFKFRSVSPKFKLTNKVRMLKKGTNDVEKASKSFSVMSKVSKIVKSQSVLQKVSLLKDNNKFSSTYCLQQNQRVPSKLQKKNVGATKLKKEGKLHRIERIYQKAQ